MTKTTLCLDEEVHRQFSELKDSFDSLSKNQKKDFILRNGFNLNGYKDFVESAIMVMVTLGRIKADIKVHEHKFMIDPKNFKKIAPFRDESIPNKWKIVPTWLFNDCDMYEKF
jgi:hypothetical protein